MPSFSFDVYLMFTPRDRGTAKGIAARLRQAGLRVVTEDTGILQFIRARASSDDELTRSRVLVLLLSRASTTRDWERIAPSTTLFRDGHNDDGRRFIPVLIEECEIPVPIRRYRYVDLRRNRDSAYVQLIEACSSTHSTPPDTVPNLFAAHLRHRLSVTCSLGSLVVQDDGHVVFGGGADGAMRIWDAESGTRLARIRAHDNGIRALTICYETHRLITASSGGELGIWDTTSNKNIGVFGEPAWIEAMSITNMGRFLVTGLGDGHLSVWNLGTRERTAHFRAHTGSVLSLAVLPGGEHILSTGSDGSIKVWDVASRSCARILQEVGAPVLAAAILADGLHVVYGDRDAVLTIRELNSGEIKSVFEGHTSAVKHVSAASRGEILISASDQQVKLWDAKTGLCIQTVSPDSQVSGLAILADGTRFFVATRSKGLLIFDVDQLLPLDISATARQTRYANAKVVLMGEQGVGKSGLAIRLTQNDWEVTDPTHGMRVWPLKFASQTSPDDIDREIWLWDLAGQPEYRLIHQLFLDETSLALLVIDPSRLDDPFREVGDWEAALRVAVGREPRKLLVAARVDRGGTMISDEKIHSFCADHEIAGYFVTSAKTGKGCGELREAIRRQIDWTDVHWVSTPRLFKALKDSILLMRNDDVILIRFGELRQRLQISFEEYFSDEELRAVLNLLSRQGMIKQLDFGDFVLLQPEQLNNYASSVIIAARDHVDGLGCISERDVLDGHLDFADLDRLDRYDEEVLLVAMIQTFLNRALCIREETADGVKLVFPSQYKRERDIPTHPNVFVTYRFAGSLAEIYATLVVRLAYSNAFTYKEFWKNAAEFQTPEEKLVGIVMRRIAEGVGELRVFFDENVPVDTRVTFIKYVHEHLLKRAENVEREREYACPKCHEPVSNRKAILKRISDRKTHIPCLFCDTPILLIDLIEQKFGDQQFLRVVQELDARADINLDNESKELILVGHAFVIAAEAGQIYRGYTNSDHGIDGEIEFKDYWGQASGSKVYLQLKSGDSHLRERKSDGTTIFAVKEPRHLTYWMNQAYPVYLVVRSSDGEIQWMNISEYLARHSDSPPRQIQFEGRPFNVPAVMELRSQILGPNPRTTRSHVG